MTGLFTDDDVQRRLDKDAEIRAEIAATDDPYTQLPVALQLKYSRTEYLWLSDDEKSTLLQRECDPDN